ncbi:hypothetical protein CPLU01_09377 [Colletotrichum plurivorum]|uniref:Uncharacterized protein n=1 Tax=Colletotrichum plurivorum TaxID=2175906 RepID=A0A8H6K9U5_9PEZI|nr:hypothetical protein CPLU01_09377 [Colletotrichum plurivorum]
MYHPVQECHQDQTSTEPNVGRQTFDQQSDAETHHEVTDQASPFLGPALPATTTLGLLLKIGAVLSLAVLAAASGFISWLWWSPPEDERWRNWVLTPNCLQLSITVTGVISRTAISFLATLATAMIASVAIERRGVPLHTVARASIARSGVSGPLSLAQLALEQAVETTVRALLAVLILTTIAAQLTSTILLTDLRQQPIVSHPRQIPNSHNLILSDLDPAQNAQKQLVVIDSSGSEHLAQRPLSSETFAEYSAPGVQLDGVDDTGPTVRAFLPIAQQETRETIHMFQGMARVVESRVACIRPEILRLELCQTAGEICGTIQLGSVDADAAGMDPATKPLNFTCTIPSFSNPSRSKENWQFCRIIPWAFQPINWKLPSPLPGLSTDVMLVWNGFTGQDYNRADTNSTVEQVRADYIGPWLSTTYNIKSKYDQKFDTPGRDITFNMTLCLYSTGSSREEKPFSSMDQVYAQLFNHTLEETKSPALAVQAVKFMLARSVYSYYQNSYGVSGSTTIDVFEPMSLPGSFVGYWAVLTIFTAFVLAFAAIAMLFRATQYSLPDNAWHTVSQISESDELRRVTREAMAMSDDDVKRLVNETKQGKGLVGQAQSLLRELLSVFWSRDAGIRFAIRDGVFVRVPEGKPSTHKETKSLETERTA